MRPLAVPPCQHVRLFSLPSAACESLPVGSLPQHTPADTHTQPLGVIQALPGVWISVTTYQQGREREFKPVSPSASPPFPVSPPAFGRSAGTVEMRAPRCKVTPRAMWSRKICARKTGLVSAEAAGVPRELSEGRQAGRKQTGGFPEQPPGAGPRCTRCTWLNGEGRGVGGCRGATPPSSAPPPPCASVPHGCRGKHCGMPVGSPPGCVGSLDTPSPMFYIATFIPGVQSRVLEALGTPHSSYPTSPVSGSCPRPHRGPRVP